MADGTGAWYDHGYMVRLNAHFDGKMIVPDEPLPLKPNQRVRIQVEPIEAEPAETMENARREFGQQKGVVLHVAPDFDEHLGDDFWGLADDKTK
ncbi:MAG: hypothetical protein JNG88_02235 [Phycisphaerales bacterium]|nr:hypothetical protein [Phycisphaerales bacterium]